MNNTKIGIITCGKEPNYGACLQALATQYKVSQLGYENELMNYSFMDEKLYSPLHQKGLRNTISSLLFYPLRRSLHFAFQGFREKHMNYSLDTLRMAEDFQKIKDEYDAFLVGSDQVWNPNLGIDINVTLLRFYDKGPRRLSYASSFGVSSLSNELHDLYRNALSKFDSISTRETTGKKMVFELTEKECVVSLDPTMLLPASEWNQFEECFNSKDKYVLIYDMSHSQKVFDTAKVLAKELNCKILALSRIVVQDRKIRTLYGVSPGQFLSLIKNAEAIVTDSFHGTVFSITYNKNFYSYCSTRGMKIGSRITNILSILGLEDRLISDSDSVNFSDIDYNFVNAELDNLRSISLNYLKKALSGQHIDIEDSIERHISITSSIEIKHVGDKNKGSCCGCGICSTTCPVKAISLRKDTDGFMYPVVDENLCINCQKCLKICAFGSSYCDNNCKKPLFEYIARAKDNDVVMNSASGGLFTVLSDEILSRNGIVYGATYQEDNSVAHIRADTKQERNKMRGSKYVQSDLQTTFGNVLSDLMSQKWVLFSGTPCQIAGIHSFLLSNQVDTSRLILCDIICHGVCSPTIFEKYLSFVEKKVGNITSINTRDKKYGSGYNMTICGEKGTYHKKGEDDPFIRLFQKNLPLRHSCFECPMKRWERISDITIGDFQKAKIYFPEYVDGRGVSVVLVNTDKGQTLFEKVKCNLNFKATTMEAASQVNLCSQIENKSKRDSFFEEYHEQDFTKLLRRYTTLGFKNKVIYLLKKSAKKILRKNGG